VPDAEPGTATDCRCGRDAGVEDLHRQPYACDVSYVDPPRPPEYPAPGERRARLRPGRALWNALLATVAVGGVVVVSVENLLHLPAAVRWGVAAIVVGGTFIVSVLGLDD
jgi:hypothetical protein